MVIPYFEFIERKEESCAYSNAISPKAEKLGIDESSAS